MPNRINFVLSFFIWLIYHALFESDARDKTLKTVEETHRYTCHNVMVEDQYGQETVDHKG